MTVDLVVLLIAVFVIGLVCGNVMLAIALARRIRRLREYDEAARSIVREIFGADAVPTMRGPER